MSSIKKNFTFIKMEGLGNDYIYIDVNENISMDINNVIENVPMLCDRHFGIGGDGVIFVAAPKNEDMWMDIYNPDGSVAGMCGNGARCVGKILYDKGYSNGKKTFNIFVKGSKRLISATVLEDDQVKIDMGIPRIDNEETLNIDGKDYKFKPIDVGNPHAVIFVDDPAKVEICNIGPKIEKHKRFPKGTNVEFIKVESKNLVRMRVWERGVGETMACGSGACATGITAIKAGKTNDEVSVQMPGGKVTITLASDQHIYLTGPVRYVFKGEYQVRS